MEENIKLNKNKKKKRNNFKLPKSNLTMEWDFKRRKIKLTIFKLVMEEKI
jgi:hypothetical protein